MSEKVRNSSLLALLTAQAEARGVDLATLRGLIEESSELGAERALGALGLKDVHARRDMDELRELLQAWRREEIGVERGGDLDGQDPARGAGAGDECEARRVGAP